MKMIKYIINLLFPPLSKFKPCSNCGYDNYGYGLKIKRCRCCNDRL